MRDFGVVRVPVPHALLERARALSIDPEQVMLDAFAERLANTRVLGATTVVSDDTAPEGVMVTIDSRTGQPL